MTKGFRSSEVQRFRGSKVQGFRTQNAERFLNHRSNFVPFEQAMSAFGTIIVLISFLLHHCYNHHSL